MGNSSSRPPLGGGNGEEDGGASRATEAPLRLASFVFICLDIETPSVVAAARKEAAPELRLPVKMRILEVAAEWPI